MLEVICSIIGALVGSRILGFFGSIIGFFVGAGICRAAMESQPGGSKRTRTRNARKFCEAAASMLAKIAKADGVITKSEINAVEVAFARLGFSDEMRRIAIARFRAAKDDSRTIYDYARLFCEEETNPTVRRYLYSLLWDVACSDGRVDAREKEMLRNVAVTLRLSPWTYVQFATERAQYTNPGSNEEWRRSAPPREEKSDSLEKAYKALGADKTMSDAELKSLYRQKAKQNHPDTLRRRGLTEEMIQKATAEMAIINNAWDEIKRARNIK